jgi:hypothetical protein
LIAQRRMNLIARTRDRGRAGAAAGRRPLDIGSPTVLSTNLFDDVWSLSQSRQSRTTGACRAKSP